MRLGNVRIRRAKSRDEPTEIRLPRDGRFACLPHAWLARIGPALAPANAFGLASAARASQIPAAKGREGEEEAQEESSSSGAALSALAKLKEPASFELQNICGTT
jgi:hypothetical protein